MPLKEFYFTVLGSESDLVAIEWMIQEYCENNKLDLIYYRKIKTGHVPCWREAKVVGEVDKFKSWAKRRDISIDLHTYEDAINDL